MKKGGPRKKRSKNKARSSGDHFMASELFYLLSLIFFATIYSQLNILSRVAVENWLNDPTATCSGKVLNPTRHESVRKDVFVPSPHKNSFLFIRGIFYFMKKIPEGLVRCEVCGEYKGEVKEKDLNWNDLYFNKAEAEKSEEYLSVSCLCDGILCHKCKKNKIHRPISNSYDEIDNDIGYWPWFTGMMPCKECK